MSGRCLECVWRVPVRCLERVRMSGLCLDRDWMVGDFWKVSVKVKSEQVDSEQVN